MHPDPSQRARLWIGHNICRLGRSHILAPNKAHLRTPADSQIPQNLLVYLCDHLSLIHQKSRLKGRIQSRGHLRDAAVWSVVAISVICSLGPDFSRPCRPVVQLLYASAM